MTAPVITLHPVRIAAALTEYRALVIGAAKCSPTPAMRCDLLAQAAAAEALLWLLTAPPPENGELDLN